MVRIACLGTRRGVVASGIEYSPTVVKYIGGTSIFAHLKPLFGSFSLHCTAAWTTATFLACASFDQIQKARSQIVAVIIE